MQRPFPVCAVLALTLAGRSAAQQTIRLTQIQDGFSADLASESGQVLCVRLVTRQFKTRSVALDELHLYDFSLTVPSLNFDSFSVCDLENLQGCSDVRMDSSTSTKLQQERNGKALCWRSMWEMFTLWYRRPIRAQLDASFGNLGGLECKSLRCRHTCRHVVCWVSVRESGRIVESTPK